MKMTFDMPSVMSCNSSDCVYNKNNSCHAHAITIGDGTEPDCDTHYCCGMHCHSDAMAGVGACKVTGCKFNMDFECSAQNIKIATQKGVPMCQTCEM